MQYRLQRPVQSIISPLNHSIPCSSTPGGTTLLGPHKPCCRRKLQRHATSVTAATLCFACCAVTNRVPTQQRRQSAAGCIRHRINTIGTEGIYWYRVAFWNQSSTSTWYAKRMPRLSSASWMRRRFWAS
jgi:hypothetical protein